MRQVLRAGALGWPRGMGWGGRWEGASGWGTHVNPWLIHVNVWQKPLQYCKVISLQLIKIKEKKSLDLNKSLHMAILFSLLYQSYNNESLRGMLRMFKYYVSFRLLLQGILISVFFLIIVLISYIGLEWLLFQCARGQPLNNTHQRPFSVKRQQYSCSLLLWVLLFIN